MSRLLVFLVMFDTPDLTQGGGAQRRYGQILEGFRDDPEIDLRLISDPESLAELNRIGLFPPRSHLFPSYSPSRPWKALLQFLLHCKLRYLSYTLGFLRLIPFYLRLLFFLWRKPCILHLCFFDLRVLPVIALLSRFRNIRVVHHNQSAFLAHDLVVPKEAWHYDRDHVTPSLFLRLVRYRGFFSLYRAFCDLDRIKRYGAPCHAIQHTFYGIDDRWKSASELLAEKKNVVAFAHRMVATKNPLVFCETILLLRQRRPDLAQGWRFELYGGGSLERDVDLLVQDPRLAGMARRTIQTDVTHGLEESWISVSLHTVENFPSMTLLQAMKAMNCIIATDVGETRRILHDGNAILLKELTPETLLEALVKVMDDSELLRRLALRAYEDSKAHTFAAFKKELKDFWLALPGFDQKPVP